MLYTLYEGNIKTSTTTFSSATVIDLAWHPLNSYTIHCLANLLGKIENVNAIQFQNSLLSKNLLEMLNAGLERESKQDNKVSTPK